MQYITTAAIPYSTGFISRVAILPSFIEGLRLARSLYLPNAMVGLLRHGPGRRSHLPSIMRGEPAAIEISGAAYHVGAVGWFRHFRPALRKAGDTALPLPSLDSSSDQAPYDPSSLSSFHCRDRKSSRVRLNSSGRSMLTM